MTNFEKIKKMNLADIAVFLFDIQADAMLSCSKKSKNILLDLVAFLNGLKARRKNEP